MALVTKFGKSSGSANSPQLDITIFDDGGAAIDRTTALNEAINNAPSTLYGQPVSGVASIEEFSEYAYKFVISYASPAAPGGSLLNPPTPPDTGTVVRQGSGTAAGVRLARFLEAGVVYDVQSAPAADVTTNFPKLAWHINAFLKPGVGYIPQETDFEPLPENRSLDYYIPNADLTDAYIDDIEEILGHFNSATIFGRPAGTVQLVRYSITNRNDDDWELSLGFGFQAVKTVTIASGITVSVPATHYVWERQYQLYDDTQNVIEANPWLAIVGRVWPESDLETILDLP